MSDKKAFFRHIDDAIERGKNALRAKQQRDGHWVFPLEADVTISAEYIMMNRYLGIKDVEREGRLARHIRRTRSLSPEEHGERGERKGHGGWALYYGGDMDLSASVKAYFALKLMGDDIHAPHMAHARRAIRAMGGLTQCNVFTRMSLAFHGVLPWEAVPSMPVEIVLLPSWCPFSLGKVSYWSRVVLVPVLALMALKPQSKGDHGVTLTELRVEKEGEKVAYIKNHRGTWQGALFVYVDAIVRRIERFSPPFLRRHAINKAVAWSMARRNGRDGLGGIFPAMMNFLILLDVLGYGKDDERYQEALEALRLLVFDDVDESFCQPCVSPVWDSSLALLALAEDEGVASSSHERGMAWLLSKEVREAAGDWRDRRPHVAPGGWAFQYGNDYYPDVDDTAVVAIALDKAHDPRYEPALKRAERWIIGMQSKNGGWGAFDADNTSAYLDYIPFADHGALRDPPTVDVSARCLGFLAQRGYTKEDDVIARCLAFLRREQEEDGSWFGRWGTNYIYGTWSVLSGLHAISEDMSSPYIRRAVQWLCDRQNDDGGWGESGASYWPSRRDEVVASTPSQTAWAIMALIAAHEVSSDAVKRGIEWLLAAPREEDGRWREDDYTAVGFPRVFYLRYRGYSVYFPLWALSRYRRMIQSNTKALGQGL